MKTEKERDPWCGKCIYRTGIPGRCRPCERTGDKQRFCLVKVLIAELDEKTRARRHSG